MDKLDLLKEISKIHANKCFMATNFDKALDSFNQLKIFQEQVIKADSEFQSILNEIIAWKNKL